MKIELLIAGTDTEVGKTYVSALLVAGLRAAGRRVRVHKPVASGVDPSAPDDDAALYARLADPDQPPGSACPLTFTEVASPSICARRHGVRFTRTELRERIAELRWSGDLVVEGSGGLLSPLGSDDSTILEAAAATDLAVLLVTRPHLGTLNHTSLAVEALRRRDLPLLGLVLNHHRPAAPGPAVEGVGAYLERLTGAPLLAEIFHGAEQDAGLTRRVLEAMRAA